MGSARQGADLWWAQRVSAVALAVLGLWLAIALFSLPALDYATVRAWMGRGWHAAGLSALILAAAQHNYLGLRVVSEDYVHNVNARIAILLLLRFALTLLAAAGVFAVLEGAFGRVPV